MGDMTLAEVLSKAYDLGVTGLLVVFIVQLARGELMFVKQHVALVTALNEKHKERVDSLLEIIKILKEGHDKREADLERLLEKSEKRGDEWLNMSLQQKKLVDKSLEVTAVTVTTEKPGAS